MLIDILNYRVYFDIDISAIGLANFKEFITIKQSILSCYYKIAIKNNVFVDSHERCISEKTHKNECHNDKIFDLLSADQFPW